MTSFHRRAQRGGLQKSIANASTAAEGVFIDHQSHRRVKEPDKMAIWHASSAGGFRWSKKWHPRRRFHQSGTAWAARGTTAALPSPTERERSRVMHALMHTHVEDLSLRSGAHLAAFFATLQRSTAWRRCSVEAVFVAAAVCHMYIFLKDHLMLHNTVFTVLLQNMSRATG